MQTLYILLVLLLLTRVFGEIAERCKQPPLVGELLSGVALGVVVGYFGRDLPVLSGLVDNEVFLALTDLGVFFLMLHAGIALRPKELAESSGSAFLVAIGGMVVPMASGMGLAWIFIPQSEVWLAQALFLGVSLAITAVPVAVRILMDMGRLESKVGRMILSAAVFDDILSLVLLAILTSVLSTGGFPSGGELAMLGLRVGGFFLIMMAMGLWVLPRLGNLVRRLHSDELDFSFVLLAGLAAGVLAEYLDMHFLIGAFVVGLFFGRSTIDEEAFEAVRARISGISTGFLAPIFFASIGLHLDLGAVTGAPIFLATLLFVAFGGKLLGCGLTARWTGLGNRESTAVGIAMSARGAVELIIADVALRAGLFSKPDPVPTVVANLFSAIVFMALATTLATPILLRMTLKKGPEAED
ncbi:MAG: cation:proton antiporter [Planctomycetota bacterium]